jgi:hypothetical protein
MTDDGWTNAAREALAAGRDGVLTWEVRGARVEIDNWRVDLDDETERADVRVTMPGHAESVATVIDFKP